VELGQRGAKRRILGLDLDRLHQESLGFIDATLGRMDQGRLPQHGHPIRGGDGAGIERQERSLRVARRSMGPRQTLPGAGVGGVQRDRLLQVGDRFPGAAGFHQEIPQRLERTSMPGAKRECRAQRLLGAGGVPEVAARPTETGQGLDVAGVERDRLLVGDQGLAVVFHPLVQTGHLAVGRGGGRGVELDRFPVGALRAIRLEAFGAEIAGPEQEPGPLQRRELGEPAELLVEVGISGRELDREAVRRHRLGAPPGAGEDLRATHLGIAVSGIQPGGLAVELEGAIGSRPAERRVRPGHQHGRIAAGDQGLPHLEPVAVPVATERCETRALRRRHLARGGGGPLDLPPEHLGGPARSPLQLPPRPDQLQRLDGIESPPVAPELGQARRRLRGNRGGRKIDRIQQADCPAPEQHPELAGAPLVQGRGYQRPVRPVVEAEADLRVPGPVVELAHQDQGGAACSGEPRRVGPPQRPLLAREDALRGGADTAALDHLHSRGGDHRGKPLLGSVRQGCEESLRPGRGDGEPVPWRRRGVGREARAGRGGEQEQGQQKRHQTEGWDPERSRSSPSPASTPSVSDARPGSAMEGHDRVLRPVASAS